MSAAVYKPTLAAAEASSGGFSASVPSQREAQIMLGDLLEPRAVISPMRFSTKKQVLQELASKAAQITGLPELDILDTLVQRERLGSTGVGNGIAIPHGKSPNIGQVMGVFARLERPIDFESLDGEPVDLIFLLLAPEDAGADHLKALARVARVLRDPRIAQKLRATQDAAAIHALLTQATASFAA